MIYFFFLEQFWPVESPFTSLIPVDMYNQSHILWAVGLSRERGSLLLLDQRKLVCSSATIGFHGGRGCYLTFTPPCKTTTESFSLKVLDTFFGDRLSSLICYQIVDV